MCACVCVILSCVQLLNGPPDLPYVYKFYTFLHFPVLGLVEFLKQIFESFY